MAGGEGCGQRAWQGGRGPPWFLAWQPDGSTRRCLLLALRGAGLAPSPAASRLGSSCVSSTLMSGVCEAPQAPAAQKVKQEGGSTRELCALCALVSGTMQMFQESWDWSGALQGEVRSSHHTLRTVAAAVLASALAAAPPARRGVRHPAARHCHSGSVKCWQAGPNGLAFPRSSDARPTTARAACRRAGFSRPLAGPQAARTCLMFQFHLWACHKDTSDPNCRWHLTTAGLGSALCACAGGARGALRPALRWQPMQPLALMLDDELLQGILFVPRISNASARLCEAGLATTASPAQPANQPASS